MDNTSILWFIFLGTAFILFFLDIKLSTNKTHEISPKEAILLCSFWILIATIYGFIIGHLLSLEKMFEFFTAYAVEYSLSVDNMFVFLIIFSYFGIPRKFQPKILTWGILGAVIMRLIFIFTGITLINKFHWLIYIFGILLIYTAFKMYFSGDEKIEPEKNWVLKFFSRLIPFDIKGETNKFFVIKENKLYATPLFAALIVIESSDLIFAIDSIPAVLAISTDKLIVYTSNVFAVVGLRSLYFLLASISTYFRFLKTGVSIVLFFVGMKMLTSGFYKIPAIVSLLIVIIILSISMIFSVLLLPQKEKVNKNITS